MNAILESLGAEDESAALRIIAESNQFMADVKSATGKDTFAGALALIRAAIALSRDVEKVTEKPQTEAIGVVMAWKSAAEQVPALQQRNTDLEEELRLREVQELVAQGKRDGKLTEATAKFWAERKAEELKAFLAVAPRVIPNEVKVPPTAPKSSSEDPPAAAATADGKRYEDIKPIDRSQLKKNDPDLYHALRSDWEKRGKPAAPSAN